jgi:hypothetical protein
MRRLPGITILIAAIVAACDPGPPPYLGLVRSKSPDGKWIADAITQQDNRPGHSGARTAVYLKSTTDPDAKASVLVFPDAAPKEKDKIHISFLWSDGTLDVLLSRTPTFETQVTRYAGINITVSQFYEKPTPLSAKQLEDLFHSSDLKSARRLLADLHCNPKMSEQVAAVRQAWHGLGGTLSTEVTQDDHIQAVMAECLIEAQPPNAATDPDIDSAVAFLRTAVHSDNIIDALVAGEGLIHYGDPRDNQSIVDIAVREPKMTTFLATVLIYNCSPNAARTLQLMREQARDPTMKKRLEAAISRAEPDHQEKCRAIN